MNTFFAHWWVYSGGMLAIAFGEKKGRMSGFFSGFFAVAAAAVMVVEAVGVIFLVKYLF